MRRTLPLALLAALAVPAAAQAAPAKLSPKASPVDAAGVTSIEAANPNTYVLRGKAAVAVAGRTVASRNVKLGRRSVTPLSLRLDRKALDALRAAGGRATITLKLRRANARKTTTAKRTLTLALPQAAAPGSASTSTSTPAQPPAGAKAPSTAPAPAPAPAPTAPSRWAGRMGTEGGYDDFEFTLDNGQMTITKPPTVPVSCMENGGSYRISISMELFDANGPWTIGTNGLVAKQGIAVNQIVNSGAKTINYKVEETSQAAGKVTGKFGMSFSDSRLDILNNYSLVFINCAGTQSFEAVPA